MNEINRFAELARRIRSGDEAARRQFRSELAPCLAPIVKRARQTTSDGSRVHRQVRSVAARLAGADGPVETAALAGDVSRLVTARLWPGGTDLCAGTIA